MPRTILPRSHLFFEMQYQIIHVLDSKEFLLDKFKSFGVHVGNPR
jgi:hypothetical protein